MGNGKTIGFYLLIVGIILLLIYGLYQFVKEISGINTVVLIGTVTIIIGAIILIVSLILEQKKDMEKRRQEIKKEDLEP